MFSGVSDDWSRGPCPNTAPSTKGGLKTAMAPGTPPRVLKVFTDGSCKGNGKKTAIGGYAAIFVEGPWEGRQLCGHLQNTTNIRAEGTAIIKVLEELAASPNEWDICEIYTDSEFWLKMVMQYMPKWSASNFDVKANPDLTKHMWALWNTLLGVPKQIKIIWVPAHNKKKTANSADPYEKFCFVHNDRADKLASEMTLKNIN